MTATAVTDRRARVSGYTEQIRAILAQSSTYKNIDPRYVEAYMRLQYGTLDHLDYHTFKAEVFIGAQCVTEATELESMKLAISYGLIVPEKKKVVLCANCGLYRRTGYQGSCVTMDTGAGNSANPTGSVPVPAGEHEWKEVEE